MVSARHDIPHRARVQPMPSADAARYNGGSIRPARGRNFLALQVFDAP